MTSASTAVAFALFCAVEGLRSQWMSAEIRLSAFEVLSYAGMLTIVIIDRDHGLDLDKLIVGLQNESKLITRHANACGDPAWLLTDSL